MALARGTLSFPISVGAGTTVGIVTVSSSKKIYIKSIVIYNANVGTGNTNLTQTVQIHMVPNDGGSAGTASSTNRIFRGSLEPDDTFTFEPNYPITLSSDGDSIRVFNEGTNNGGVATNPVNVLILGDKEI
jgi:hypothetical protein